MLANLWSVLIPGRFEPEIGVDNRTIKKNSLEPTILRIEQTRANEYILFIS